MGEEISYNMDEIQRNFEKIDAESIHMKILEDLKSGKFDTYFDAFANFVKEYDIDLENIQLIRNFITPSLYGSLYREARDKALLKEKAMEHYIEDFF